MTDMAQHHSLTDEILDEMTTILVAAQNVTLRVQEATDIAPSDREALLRMTTRVSAQADAILAWLMDTPLDTARH
jgi:hypothetical protein